MNAYWDAVRPYVVDGVIRRDGFAHHEAWADGMRMRYSWTVTDPATVGFVRCYVGEYAVDPFASAGWWGRLLREADRDVLSYDIAAPAETWSAVGRCDALDAVGVTIPASEVLLLSWPPRHDPIGERAVRAYRGNRIVHMGAEGRTSDGTDGMRRLLADEWVQVAQHTPVRWPGVKDFVTVYERST